MVQLTKDRFEQIDEILARTNDTLREVTQQLGEVAQRQAGVAQWQAECAERQTRFAEQQTALEEQQTALEEQQTRFAMSWSVENQMLKDRTEKTRAHLQERMDVLERVVGRRIDRIVDHSADPETHEESP